MQRVYDSVYDTPRGIRCAHSGRVLVVLMKKIRSDGASPQRPLAAAPQASFIPARRSARPTFKEQRHKGLKGAVLAIFCTGRRALLTAP